MAGEKAKLLCSFGGDFVLQQGKTFYVGGETRLVSIHRSASFRALLEKMSEICDADPGLIDIRFQLPDVGLDSRLIFIENDDDVLNMMEEFDANRKIPIFMFIEKMQNTDDEEIAATEDGMQPLQVAGMDAVRNSARLLSLLWLKKSAIYETALEVALMAAEEQLDSQGGPSSSRMSSRRDFVRNTSSGPSLSGEIFRQVSKSLVVGQEYEDVQTFRNALTSAAIAANFELHMIRSDQRRVTARCAAGGCTWRVHASKLPHVSIFRIKTLTPEHTCIRSEDAGHRALHCTRCNQIGHNRRTCIVQESMQG